MPKKPQLRRDREPTAIALPDAVHYRFGKFQLFPAQQLLFEDGRQIPIGSRGISLLEAFVRQPGVLLTKEELFKLVWPGVYVEDSNLKVNISVLRRALQDGRHDRRFIVNEHGHGYRFVASVS